MLSTTPLLDYSPWSALSAPTLCCREKLMGKRRAEHPSGPDQQKAWGPQPCEHSRSQLRMSDVYAAELLGCTQVGGFLAHPVRNTEAWYLQQGEKLVSGKNMKGISKMSLFFLPLGRSRRQNLLCKMSSRNRVLSASSATDEKNHGVITIHFCASLLWGARAHILYWQQERSFCLCKTLFFFWA